ncbi:MAG: hypothetical protein KGI54_04035 [Pseudomonadota bacterium]|nr:hypothetical protein [Pseudomonadota bacterium]
MNRTDFDEFVQRQHTKQQKEKELDPKKKLRDWLEHLGSLYSQIKKFMKSYLDSGDAKIEFRKIQLNEEFIGLYDADQLVLTIGRSVVTFTPIGTMLIGLKGRVDVQGARGQARLSLVNKQVNSAHQLIRVTVSVAGEAKKKSSSPDEIKEIEWTWKIFTAPPQMKFIDLTQEAFFDMILSIADA